MPYSLVSFLKDNQKKFGGEYEEFLTAKGGFPVVSKEGKWNIKKSIPKGKQVDYFASLAEKIVEEGDQIAKLPNSEKLVKRFNIEWMKIRGEKTVLEKHSVTEIWFNYKSEDYYWLSNLFQTLIYSEKPFPQIFIGAESGFKAYKAFIAGKDKETTSSIAKATDPKKVKKIKVHVSTEKAVALMKHLIKCKFSQNPLLAQRLAATEPLQLVEHTDHPFWGDGSSSGAKDKGTGKNKLGQILMTERKALST